MNGSEPEHLTWFEKAEHDFLIIKKAMVGDDVPWDMVTFHAQQAAEKYLKGFLVYHARKPPKTHDLVELLVICADFSQELSLLRPDCRELTQLGFVSRYPDEPGEPTEVETRRAVEIAQRVRDAVLQRVPK